MLSHDNSIKRPNSCNSLMWFNTIIVLSLVACTMVLCTYSIPWQTNAFKIIVVIMLITPKIGELVKK